MSADINKKINNGRNLAKKTFQKEKSCKNRKMQNGKKNIEDEKGRKKGVNS